MVHKVVSPTKPVGVPLAHGSHAREAVGALEPVLFIVFMHDAIAVAYQIVIRGEVHLAILVRAGETAFASGRFRPQFLSTRTIR
jgi:hypothetical protein